MDAGELSSLRPRTPEPPRSDPGAEPSASGLWRAGAGLPTAGWWRGAGSDPVPAAREAAPSGRRPTSPYLAAQLGHHMDATFSRVKGNLERNQPGAEEENLTQETRKLQLQKRGPGALAGVLCPDRLVGGPARPRPRRGLGPTPRARLLADSAAPPCGQPRRHMKPTALCGSCLRRVEAGGGFVV